MLSKTWWQWLALTILIGIVYTLLDAIFDKNTQISFVDLGFIAFVSIWCAKHDEAKRRKETNYDNQ